MLSTTIQKSVTDHISALTDAVRSTGQQLSSDVVAWVSGWLLVNWYEHLERERSTMAAFEGNEYASSLPNAISFWHELTLEQLDIFILQDLMPATEMIPGVSKAPEVLRGVPFGTFVVNDLDDRDIHTKSLTFSEIDPDDPVWSWLRTTVGPIRFQRPDDVALSAALIEGLLQSSTDEIRSAEYFTPRPIVELMVEIGAPQAGDRVYDPCFGAGGLLVESARRVKSLAGTCAAGQWDRIRRQSIFGVERNPIMYVIASARIVFAGIPEPGLELADALARPQVAPGDRFDLVLACPPWGYMGRVGKQEQFRYEHLPIRSNDLTNLFLQHIMQALRPGGRAVVALPESTLFRPGADGKVRQRLLEEFCVDGVISLPQGTFAPYTGIKADLLTFRRAKPKESVRFVQTKGLRGTKGSYSYEEADSPQSLAARLSSGESSDISWSTSIADLKKRDWELVAKKSGAEQLTRWLDRISNADPAIEISRLDKIADVITGVSYERDTTTEDRATQGTVPLVRVSDLTNGGVRAPRLYLTEEGQARVRPEHVVKRGDIVLSTSGTIGKVALVKDRDKAEGYVVAKSLAIIRPMQAAMAEFLAALLDSRQYQEWLLGHARGSAIQHLSVRTFRNLPVPVPELPLQERVIKARMRKGGGDALAILTELASTKDETSAVRARKAGEVAELMSLIEAQREKSSNTLESLGRIADAYVVNEIPLRRDELDDWWPTLRVSLRTAMLALVGVQNIEQGPALYAVLQDARRDFDAFRGSLAEMASDPGYTDDRDTVAGANRFISEVASFIETSWRDLLMARKIEAAIDDIPIGVGEEQEVTVRILNKGPLPLRNLTVETSPNWGSASIPYLPQNSQAPFPINVPGQKNPGVFEFDLKWSGQEMNGTAASGTFRLAIQVRSTRDLVHVGDLGASPYVTGSPVDREEMFFGRADIVRRIQTQLSTTHRANVILLEGNRRSGKTSILNHLLKSDVLPGWLPVYCSFQGATGDQKRAGLPTGQVFKTLALKIFASALRSGHKLWLPGLKVPDNTQSGFEAEFVKACNVVFKEENPFETFELFLGEVLRTIAPTRLLLMLDEFDKIQDGIDSGVTSPQVPENLRYLLHGFAEISAILSYSKLLRRLREEYWSVLFGLGYPLSVGALDNESARELVSHPAEGRLLYVEEARERVIALCARQPYLIQSMCNRIFESAVATGERTVTLRTVESAADSMAADNEHFATLWNHHVGGERRRYILALCKLLEAGPDPITLRLIELKLEEAGIAIAHGQDLGEDLKHLRILDLLDMEDGGRRYRLSVPLMGAWIRQNVDIEDLRRRAVREYQEEIL